MSVEIFEINGSVVRPVKDVLLIFPFNEIWDRDTSKHKSIAINELAYIYYIVSPKKSNPYSGYSNELRGKKIIEGLWKENVEEWKPDELVKEGVSTYSKWLEEASPSMRYFNAVKSGVEQTINFFQNIDFNERTDKGLPVYKISEVIPALKSANEVLKSMSDLQERVEQEVYESSKTKAGKEINPFER
jgi:hypothetical protein